MATATKKKEGRHYKTSDGFRSLFYYQEGPHPVLLGIMGPDRKYDLIRMKKKGAWRYAEDVAGVWVFYVVDKEPVTVGVIGCDRAGDQIIIKRAFPRWTVKKNGQ